MNESGSWLTTGFIRALKSLGASVADELLRGEAERLLGIWGRTHRVFHGKSFLVQVLNFLDEHDASIHKPAQLVVAAWYHGSVEQNCQGGSQTRSINNYASAANYVAEHLPEFGLSNEITTRIAELVLFCQHKEAPRQDSDACIFIDATLSYMAQMPQDYRRSLELLRQEMSHLDQCFYARLRRSFIRSLLERDTIFSSPFAAEHEKTARHNLEGELAQLNQLIPENSRNSLKDKLEGKAVVRKSILQMVTGEGNTGITTTGSINPLTSTKDSLSTTLHPSQLGKSERGRQLEQLEDEREDLSSMESVEEFLSTISLARVKNPGLKSTGVQNTGVTGVKNTGVTSGISTGVTGSGGSGAGVSSASAQGTGVNGSGVNGSGVNSSGVNSAVSIASRGKDATPNNSAPNNSPLNNSTLIEQNLDAPDDSHPVNTFDPVSRIQPGEAGSRARLIDEELHEADGSTLSSAPVYNLETKPSSPAHSGAIPLVKGPHCQIIPLQREPLTKPTPLVAQSQAHIRLLDLPEEEEPDTTKAEAEDLHLTDDQLDRLDED